MADQRRPLTAGIEQDTSIKGKEFVFGDDSTAPTPASKPATSPVKTPLTTRVRGDYVKALQRASLERKMNDEQLHTVQDIIEEALEQWLREHGCLD